MLAVGFPAGEYTGFANKKPSATRAEGHLWKVAVATGCRSDPQSPCRLEGETATPRFPEFSRNRDVRLCTDYNEMATPCKFDVPLPHIGRPTPMSCLLLCDDFFFANKITGTAQALGVVVKEVTSPNTACGFAAPENVRLIIVDLNTPGINVAELIAALPDENRPAVIAFDSHVNTERIAAAKAAGCDQVLPRSRFTAELPEILKRFSP
jgi:CheY-like chemotaxis protein